MKHKEIKNIKKSKRTGAALKRARRVGDGKMNGKHMSYDLPTAVGVMDCKGGRFGFVVREGGDDIFVSGRNLEGARHGDTVRVAIIGDRADRGGGRKLEGRVTEIIERSPLNIVATVVFENNRFYAIPDDSHYGEALEIINLGGASKHDKVIIDIVSNGYGDCADVAAVLGRSDEIGMDVLSVIAAHNLRTEFPKSALDQADAYPDVIDASEASAPYRRDYRDKIVFTIDGSDSKDFDDAVSLERIDGGYRLGVYIADVAQYVTPKSPLDKEAELRGTSVYLADRVIPMLPEKLSNGLCSLNEGEDRLVLSAIIDLDERGNVTDSSVAEGVIRSSARLTYSGVQAMLDGDEALRKRYAAQYPSLELMKELAEKRIKLRLARGAVDFKLTESEIEFDAVGHVVDVKKKKTLFSMQIIEEFMILANCAVAKRFEALKTPFVYRTHDKPSAEKLQALNDYLDAVGAPVRCPLAPEPRQVADMLEKIETVKPEIFGAASKMTLRAMAKAKYEPKNGGHFGLAEKFYCHFTSPIRRYPDLFIHRVIKAYLRGGMPAASKYRDDSRFAASQSSKCERTAQDCERKVDDLKKAEYLSHHVGETFVGTISSVTEFGFFVELDNTAEGLVRLSTLPPNAIFDARRMCIVCGSKHYGMGDRLSVVVDKVSGGKTDFVIMQY